MGPASTRALPVGAQEDGPGLDAARRRVLRVVADSGPGATVAALAGVLGGHPNTTRHHLRALVASGLVMARTDDGAGPGRPPVRYAVTPEGRHAASGAAAGDPSVEEYLALAGAFADRLAALGVDSAEESRSIGRAWGAALAARDLAAADGPGADDGAVDPGEPRRHVLALLERLGFSPRPEGREVELRTCPLLDAATRHPEVVCQVHAGLVSGADAAYGGTGEGVRLVPFARPGACHLTLPSAR